MRYRSILTLILVVLTTVLVSCSGPTVAKGPVYTEAQLEQIQRYSADIQTLRDRMTELSALIEDEKWNDVESFIHGPLGELRVRMVRLARTLEPKVQKSAQDSAKAVFDHLIAIDEAAQLRSLDKASSNYQAAQRDFESFFQLIPD
jgi:photosystem II protein PsbQ